MNTTNPLAVLVAEWREAAKRWKDFCAGSTELTRSATFSRCADALESLLAQGAAGEVKGDWVSPNGDYWTEAEVRYNGKDTTGWQRVTPVDCTEPNRAACPRLCMDFCNKAEQAATPPPSALSGAEFVLVPRAEMQAVIASLDEAARPGVCLDMLMTNPPKLAVAYYAAENLRAMLAAATTGGRQHG